MALHVAGLFALLCADQSLSQDAVDRENGFEQQYRKLVGEMTSVYGGAKEFHAKVRIML